MFYKIKIRVAIHDFFAAFRLGWPMTLRTLRGGVGVVLSLTALLAFFVAPIGITNIDELWGRTLAWVVWGVLVLFCAIVFGLTPYRGQKEITKATIKAHEADNERWVRYLDKEREKKEKLEKELAELKQELKHK